MGAWRYTATVLGLGSTTVVNLRKQRIVVLSMRLRNTELSVGNSVHLIRKSPFIKIEINSKRSARSGAGRSRCHPGHNTLAGGYDTRSDNHWRSNSQAVRRGIVGRSFSRPCWPPPEPGTAIHNRSCGRPNGGEFGRKCRNHIQFRKGVMRIEGQCFVRPAVASCSVIAN